MKYTQYLCILVIKCAWLFIVKFMHDSKIVLIIFMQ